ncbi:MAG TPA: hypothetical protein VJ743_21165 [Albitalea sp.]|nr:hypothetical protein [Albitalea sp.]
MNSEPQRAAGHDFGMKDTVPAPARDGIESLEEMPVRPSSGKVPLHRLVITGLQWLARPLAALVATYLLLFVHR